MKIYLRTLVLVLGCFILLTLVVSCDKFGNADSSMGELRIAFSESVREMTKSSSAELPDTSDFLLKVESADGKTIYSGLYRACPESIMVSSGSYIVTALSCEFTVPTFDKPQYGDEQCVIVSEGKVTDVKLTCRQMNAGVRLDINSTFLEGCPDGVLRLKSAEGVLTYTYRESRIAYFSPGAVSLVLYSGGEEQVLMTRNLQRQQIMVIGVGASVASSGTTATAGKVSVSVDTSRVWLNEDYVIGGTAEKGTSISNAYTVSQAQYAGTKKDVWVCGYIVGGDLTSTSASFIPPFTSKTNLLLGPKSVTVSRDACISVQLPTGVIRDALNLVDRSGLLGTKVYLKGDLVESYFGLVGLKSVSDYMIE